MKLVGDSTNLRQVLLEHLGNVPTIPCVVGSPPYNVGIPNYPSGYQDFVPWDDYAIRATIWAESIADILCPGGRAWVNIQPTVPFVPGEPGGDRVNLASMWMRALEAAGLRYRDTLVWVQDSFDGGCAWGSWCRPSAPNVRGAHELILLYYKDRWDRPAPDQWKGKQLPREQLGGDWAADLTRNVWKINPANHSGARRKDLPAKYPLELPARAIRLSTWPGEWVLDPWAGHCTTGEAAARLGRRSIMVDLGYGDG